MNDKEFLVKLLRDKGACDSSMEWARGLPDGTTLEEAWGDCPWLEWVGWFLETVYRDDGITREALVLVSCALVRAMYEGNPGVEMNNDAVRVLEHAESWAKGEGSSREDVKSAVRDLEVWMSVTLPSNQTQACSAAARHVARLVISAEQDAPVYGLDSFHGVYASGGLNTTPAGLSDTYRPRWHAWNKTLCDVVRGVVPWSAVWAGVQKAGWGP